MTSLHRREFMLTSLAAAAIPALTTSKKAWAAGRPFVQPPLPFGDNDLAPVISAQTVQIHYGKHHAAYYAGVNRLTENTAFASLSLEEIIKKTTGVPENQALFNQAGQAWNHDFYWQVLKPGGAKQPSGKLLEAIERDFGGFQKFKETYAQRATSIFGSGWAWLVEEEGKLAFFETSNADNPIAHGKRPLATIDVWEHAYYLDYKNLRADHVKAVIENTLNWDFVREQLT